ncbi:UNVERIFIED_CONTAM: hypothetical protein IGO34_25855, partial [Salmonella enterica subsp. enterica serovar Weltevreden]
NHQPEELFRFAAPDSLRRSLSHVFFDFVIHNQDCLPADFETIAGDVYLMIRFLDRVQQQQRNGLPIDEKGG